MPKGHYSSRKGGFQSKGRAFIGPDEAPKVIQPSKEIGPVTPMATCPVCKAEVKTRLEPGKAHVNRTRYITRHRAGGGSVVIRRGDVSCKGTDTPTDL